VDTTRETAGRLFDAHAEDLLRYLARRVGRPVAEDIVGEVFALLMRGDHQLYEGDGGERAWLFGVATNLLRRHGRDQVRALRAAGRVGAAQAPGEGFDDRSDERLDARDHVRGLTDALLELNPADLDLLLLVAWADMTPTEVAGSLGIPPGTVRSRLHRIRRRLRSAAVRTSAEGTAR